LSSTSRSFFSSASTAPFTAAASRLSSVRRVRFVNWLRMVSMVFTMPPAASRSAWRSWSIAACAFRSASVSALDGSFLIVSGCESSCPAALSLIV
jgi:hypothetical protein